MLKFDRPWYNIYYIPLKLSSFLYKSSQLYINAIKGGEVMRSKKQQMLRLTSLAVTARLRDVLMNDFSESLSAQIVKYNLYKHRLNVKRVRDSGTSRVIDSIVSDYKAIKPIGSVSVEELKKDLRLAIK